METAEATEVSLIAETMELTDPVWRLPEDWLRNAWQLLKIYYNIRQDKKKTYRAACSCAQPKNV